MKDEQTIPQTPEIEEKKPETVMQKLSAIDKQLKDIGSSKNPKKQYKLKFKTKRQLKKLHKKNKILVFSISVAGGIVSNVYPVESGTFNHKGIPRRFNLKHVFYLEGKYPCVFLPDWAVEPIAVIQTEGENSREKPLIGYEDYIQKGLPSSYAIGWLIAKINSAEVAQKKGISSKAWIVIGLVGIAAVYVLFGGVGE